MKIIVSNGRVIDPSQQFDKVADLYIADDKVLSLDIKPSNFTADQIIDASNKIVCPGLVDLYANPINLTNKQLNTFLHQANHGGITSIAIPPFVEPMLDNHISLNHLHYLVDQINTANIFPIAATSVACHAQQLTECATFAEHAITLFTTGQYDVTNNQFLDRLYQYLATFNLRLVIYPQDYDLSQDVAIHQGEVSSKWGFSGIPALAETLSIAKHVLFAETYGVKIHFSQVTTYQGIALIQQAQQKGITVTADSSIIHHFLTEIDCENGNPLCHIQPPLRGITDQNALREAVKKKVITVITSSHTQLSPDDKLATFATSKTGCMNFELLLPLTLRLGKELKLSLMDTLALITAHPAKCLEKEVGNLKVGSQADICIFDPDYRFTVSNDTLVTNDYLTPFEDWELWGKVVMTIFKGIPLACK